MNTENAGGQSVDPNAPMDDFRATAAAFSQLTGVLGGFSITVLVLVLDSTSLGANKTAQDWAVGLLLLAGFLYIYSSGLLANSMNVPVFQSRTAKYGWAPPGGLFAHQRRVFSGGIGAFHVGNIFLSLALVVIVYQYSLRVGLVATAVIVIVVARVVFVNLGGARRRRSASPNP